jgi:hypothetical protein
MRWGDPAIQGGGQAPHLIHETSEILDGQALLAITKCIRRVGVDFEDQAVGPRRERPA